jgi:hypothetical protein
MPVSLPLRSKPSTRLTQTQLRLLADRDLREELGTLVYAGEVKLPGG